MPYRMSKQSQDDRRTLDKGGDPGLTPDNFFGEVRRRRWLCLTIIGACVLAACAYALLARPVYRVTAVLIPADTSADSLSMRAMDSLGSLGSLASMVGMNLSGTEMQTTEAIAVLGSRRFTVDFIRDNDLMPRLFAKRWDKAAGQWAVAEDEVPTDAAAYKLFDEDIRTISQDKKTGIVTLTIDWFDRTEAVAWARDLVSRVNEEMRARTLRESSASLERLEQQVTQTKVVAVQESLAKLIENQVRHKILATVRPDYAFRIVDPPAAPDADDPVHPRWAVVLAAGFLAGLVVSAVVVILGVRVRPRISTRP